MPLELPNSKRALIKKAGSSIFIAVAIAAVVAAFSVVAINFMWGQAEYNNKVNDEKEIARDTLKANIKNAESLKVSFEELEAGEDLIKGQGDKPNSAVILDALPRKYDFPALRTSLEQLAEMSGVQLSNFTGNDQEADAIQSMTDPAPQEIIFSVVIDSDYKSLIKFVENMEHTIRPLRIEKLRISGSDDSMSASIDLITYYQPSVDIDVQTKVVAE